MKWLSAIVSFLFVTAGVFFVVGWCVLPQPVMEVPEQSRLDRLAHLRNLDWAQNRWGFAIGPACGACSAWLTFRRRNRNSRS